MKHIIKLINIPSDIIDNVHKCYEVGCDIELKVGESLNISDYIDRIVFLDTSIFGNNNNICYAYTHKPLGNKISLVFNIIEIKNYLQIQDYRREPEIKSAIKIYYVEYTKQTIDKIRELIKIDKEIQKKQIDFGDE